jgi:hypothetical protein
MNEIELSDMKLVSSEGAEKRLKRMSGATMRLALLKAGYRFYKNSPDAPVLNLNPGIWTW